MRRVYWWDKTGFNMSETCAFGVLEIGHDRVHSRNYTSGKRASKFVTYLSL